jgi:hypothetical protein
MATNVEYPMTDMLGQDISVGDLVVYTPPYSRCLDIGRIVKFNPKTVRVERVTNTWSEQANVYRTNLCKAPEEYAMLALLSQSQQ